jgi:transposase
LLEAEEISQPWCMDEGRFGLKVWFRRRWCPKGVRPVWEVQDRYEWRWLYAAIEPTTGQSYFLLLPRVDRHCLQVFLEHFAAAQGATSRTTLGLVWDGSGSHRSTKLVWPAGLKPLPLPPYSPELNPAEQVMRVLRERLANRIFADLAELDEAIEAVLHAWWADPTQLQRLTGYDWWCDGVTHITPSLS